MKRILLMVLRLFYKAPGWFYKICKYGKDEKFEKYSDEERYRVLQELTTRANRAGRVKVACYGHENLPKENGFILFPNHQGLFDSLIFFQTLDRPFSIIMKKEVENWFLVKQVRRMIGAKLIDRQDLRQSMTVIRQVTKEVCEGRNYIIFPEGTRSRNGNELLEFKGGSFKSAMNAKCPIVPVALIDSFKAFDTHSIKPLTVQVHYLPPLYYEDYKGMKSQEIARLVEERIQTAIHLAVGEGAGANVQNQSGTD